MTVKDDNAAQSGGAPGAPSPETAAAPAPAGETSGAPAAGETTSVAPAGETPARTSAASADQTVPLGRFQAVVGERRDATARAEALARQLELANQTIAEFQALAGAGASKPAADAGAPKPAAQRPLSPEQLQALVAQEAQNQNFNQRCNAEYAKGKEAHADYDQVVGALTKLSPISDPRTGQPLLPRSLVEAAVETGSGAEVLYALGRDSALADRIMTLSPTAQAVEMAKLALKLEKSSASSAAGETGAGDTGAEAADAEPQVSRAPAPVKPRAGASSPKPSWTPENTEQFSTEEWIAQREAQIARQRQNGAARR